MKMELARTVLSTVMNKMDDEGLVTLLMLCKRALGKSTAQMAPCMVMVSTSEHTFPSRTCVTFIYNTRLFAAN